MNPFTNPARRIPNPNDMSCSMMIDHSPSSTSDFAGIQARTPDQWEEDSTVHRCFKCNEGFVLLWRARHHCRCCGRIFCSQCSAHTCQIPDYLKIPLPSEARAVNRTQKQRVCDTCHEKLMKLREMEGLMEQFKTTELDILRLQELARAHDSMSSQLANFYLSKLRELQYALPGHPFTRQERKMLWVNRTRFVGHNRWMVQFLKSINYATASDRVITSVLAVLARHQEFNEHAALGQSPPISCKQLMCTRSCQPQFDVECALQLLNRTVQCTSIREYAISFLNPCPTSELRCYLPYLVRHSIYASVVYTWLLSRCAKSLLVASEVWWELHTCLARKGTSAEVIHAALSDWKRQVPAEFQRQIALSQLFVEKVRMATSQPQQDALLKLLEHRPRVVSPLDPEQGTLEVQLCGIKQMKSITNPTVIPLQRVGLASLPAPLHTDPWYNDPEWEHMFLKCRCQCVTCRERQLSVTDSVYGGSPVTSRLHDSCDTGDITTTAASSTPSNDDDTQPTETLAETWRTHRILAKPEDLRKDQIIISVIRVMDGILKREEGLDLNIQTYNVRPTSVTDGFVEMVPNCATLDHIRYTKDFTLLNYMIEKNPDEVTSVIRARFMQSCAAYCVITYLLGVGDRHLDNVLMTGDGVLFHIDYGFILGQNPPKPLRAPKIQISDDMLDALGGKQSATFGEFKKLCSVIFNALRRHINLFVCLLSLLVDADPVIDDGEFTRERLMDEIRTRFLPGESYQQAEIQLYNQIDNCASHSFSNNVGNFFHRLKKEETVKTALKGALHQTVNTSKALLDSLWGILYEDHSNAGGSGDL